MEREHGGDSGSGQRLESDCLNLNSDSSSLNNLEPVNKPLCFSFAIYEVGIIVALTRIK